MDVGGCFLVGKAARVKLTTHLHPSAEVKNGCRYTSSPPYALTGTTWPLSHTTGWATGDYTESLPYGNPTLIACKPYCSGTEWLPSPTTHVPTNFIPYLSEKYVHAVTLLTCLREVANNRPGHNYSHSGTSWFSSARVNAGHDRLLFNSLSTNHTIILRYWYKVLLTASFNKPQMSYIYIATLSW